MIFDWPLMPPTQLILIISLLIAIFTALFTGCISPFRRSRPARKFLVVAYVVAYLVLLAGNVCRGL